MKAEPWPKSLLVFPDNPVNDVPIVSNLHCSQVIVYFKSMLKSLFYTNVWEQHKFKQDCLVYDGTHQTPNYTDSGIPFLSVENISDLQTNKYISFNDFKICYKVYPKAGNILMTRIGDI